MVDIAPQAVTWSGTPRVASPQYIQSTIDANVAGTTYVLTAGVHRGQSFELKAGDRLEFADGAILNGAEDVSGGWTDNGDGTWKKAITLSRQTVQSSELRTGYADWMEWPIIDGNPVPYKTTVGAVDADTAYYDSTNQEVYIGVDPTGKTVEIARAARAFGGAVSNVTVTTQSGSNSYGVVTGYASETQAENAAIYCARDTAGTLTGSGWLVENLEIKNIWGGAYAGEGTIRGCVIHHNGQIGIAQGANGWVCEYNYVHTNGINGIASGWEAGNMKISTSDNTIIRGCYFTLYDHPHLDATGPFWYDIDNDGAQIYDNIIADETTAGISSRGLFWEISYSCLVHHNVLYRLARGAENSGWASAFSGSESAAIPSTTIYDRVDVYDNIVYDCAGGLKLIDNGPRCEGARYTIDNTIDCSGGTPPSYLAQYARFQRNVVYFSSATHDFGSGAENLDYAGIVNWNTAWTPVGCSYDGNIYYVPDPSVAHWNDDQSGGGGYQTFSAWQTSGHDTNGQAVTTTSHPTTDPDPFNGGCMVGGC